MRIRQLTLIAAALCIARIAHGQGDPATISKIVDEGKNRNQAWKHLEYLSEQIGPRLTGSSRLMQANTWTRDQFASFGLHAYLFKWGEVPVAFDRGPSKVRMIKPVEQDFEFTARSWSAGTSGPVSGKVVRQPKDMAELEAMRDQLKGAWVLSKARPPFRRGQGAGGQRPRGESAAAEPAANQNAAAPNQPPSGAGNSDAPAARPANDDRPRRPDPSAENELVKAMYEAGILGRITPSANELVITSGMRNWREMDFKDLPTEVSITIRRSDYDAINSRLADGEEVVIEADLQHNFVEGPFPLYDTIAEIRGTEHPEQVVIVSGHLDSWDGPGSQGAQDNGVGSATTLETARILAAVGVKPKRTIRFCLWTGEEQGLLGSRAYVDSLSDEEKANISAVLVDDGGTNYDGGLVCVDAMAPMLRTATAAVNDAFPDMPVEIIIRERMPRGGASDHASFNRVGIPGFFWDEKGSGGREGKDYRFVHHTQHDQTRYAVPEYLVQSSTAAAITAYNLAMADALLPRYVPPQDSEAGPGAPEITAEFTPVQGPITGTWTVTVVREGAPSESRSTLKLEMSADGRARGTYSSRLGEGQIRRGNFDPQTGKLSFRFNSEMIGPITFNAVVKGDEMNGTIGGEDSEFNMPFKAVRENPAEAGSAPVAADHVGAGS